MSTSQHFIALLKSHIEGDEDHLYSVAMQVAAKEARQGHSQVALRIRNLIEEARNRGGRTLSGLLLNDGLDGLIMASEPATRLSDMVIYQQIANKLKKVIHEHRQRDALFVYNLSPRRKILLIGPPGTGKTMTARALSGELHLPLMTVTLEGVISKYMGETAAKLRQVFEAMGHVPGVYFFDEFDAIGAKRSNKNDVGEIRRILNSFLQLLENDSSDSLIVAATNHPELLDPALFRRFDDVLEYQLPERKMTKEILLKSLLPFEVSKVKWEPVLDAIAVSSQAEITKVALDAAKLAILDTRTTISNRDFNEALADRPAVFRGTAESSSINE